jgi:hypothetical protein
VEVAAVKATETAEGWAGPTAAAVVASVGLLATLASDSNPGDADNARSADARDSAIADAPRGIQSCIQHTP